MRFFPGWRAFPFWLILSVGVVIAVNIRMAVLAVGTFPGTASNAGFDTSNAYDKVLGAVRRQDALGWSVTAQGGAHPLISVRGRDRTELAGLRITGAARAPLGAQPDVGLGFQQNAPGQFTISTALPSGQYDLLLSIAAGGQVMRVTRRVFVP